MPPSGSIATAVKRRNALAMAKVAAPNVAQSFVDRAIQAFGAGGMTDENGLTHAWIARARCASPTARTKCTCKPSPRPNSQRYDA